MPWPGAPRAPWDRSTTTPLTVASGVDHAQMYTCSNDVSPTTNIATARQSVQPQVEVPVRDRVVAHDNLLSRVGWRCFHPGGARASSATADVPCPARGQAWRDVEHARRGARPRSLEEDRQ